MNEGLKEVLETAQRMFKERMLKKHPCKVEEFLAEEAKKPRKLRSFKVPGCSCPRCKPYKHGE